MNTTRTYRQGARAEATRRTREALFAEARRVFFAGAWAETSLEEIAGAAGTTKQTLLRHFGSKQGLLDAAGQYWREHTVRQRDAAPAGDVAAAVDNLLDHYEGAGPVVLRLLATVDGTGAGSGPMAEQLQMGRELHYAWVDRVFAPYLEPLTPVARTCRRAALIAACDVYTWRILALDLALPRHQVRRTLLDTIERLIAEDRP